MRTGSTGCGLARGTGPRSHVQRAIDGLKKRVAILGSTGSIGRNCLDVLGGLGDEFEVVGLAARGSWQLLAQQSERWHPRLVALCDAEHAGALRNSLNGTTGVLDGPEAMTTLIDECECDTVVCAVVGAAGLAATHRAVERGLRVALANKEAMVVAGALLVSLARERGALIIPIDSEHSAVFQAMQAGRPDEVRRVILTASGGPFREWTREQIAEATVADALNHPTWDMGPKISIDSATMMNKALEIIEARWMFGLEPENIEVVIHPESIVHSLVEFCDGSIIAQLGMPDMRIPIQYALTYPERRNCPSDRLDLTTLRQLTFEEPDEERFPALRLGREAACRGGSAGAVLNAANEAAVGLFREGKIRFAAISELVERALDGHHWLASPSLEDLMAADRWARDEVTQCATG